MEQAQLVSILAQTKILGDLRLGLAGTGVGLGVLGTTENLESRVAIDRVVAAQVLLHGAVNLGHRDVLALQLGSGLLILGGEGLAVTAPGCVELSENQGVFVDEVLEGVGGQGDDIGISIDDLGLSGVDRRGSSEKAQY